MKYRKYRWPEHYFFIWCLGNSQKLPTTNQFLVSTIFFTNVNISFFNPRCDFFSIIAKSIVNQIRNNIACAVARLVFVFYCELSTGRCNDFQYIFVVKQKKSDYYGPYFQTMLFLVTLIGIIFFLIAFLSVTVKIQSRSLFSLLYC